MALYTQTRKSAEIIFSNCFAKLKVNELQREIEERSMSHEKGMADMRSLQLLTVKNLRNLTAQVKNISQHFPAIRYSVFF